MCSVGGVRLRERQLVAQLGRQLGGEHPGVVLGIGDDAAIVRVGAEAVVSVDANVQGVHFDLRWLSLADVGYRALQAALSDLAAMGAQPRAALSAWVLPPGFAPEGVAELARGQRQAADESGCPIAGGNLSRGGELSLSTTVIGHCSVPALRRCGARPGNELWVVGDLGLSATGLAALRSWSERAPERLGSADVRACVSAWRRPRALLAEGARLAGAADAALDVSDGLVEDAAQLASASCVRVVICARRLRASLRPELLRAAKRLRRSALGMALRGGEDYALLAAGPARQRPSFARVIGWVERGRGVFLQRSARREALAGSGYDHFRR